MKARICIDKHLPGSDNRAVGVRGKFWKPGDQITISFVSGTDQQQQYVKRVAAKWLEFANLEFNYIPAGGFVRIAFDDFDGSWSYVGTDCKGIRTGPTMNFGWLDEAVVLHEYGHMLGLGHEHQNPAKPIEWDKEAVIDDLGGPPNNWNLDTIEWNVFRRYNADQVIGTDLDPESIMMYSIPNRWTVGDFETKFNESLSLQDKAFISALYPTEELPTPAQNFAKVFTSVREICRLKRSQVITMGQLVDAEVSEMNRKKTNAKAVFEVLRKFIA